MPEPVFFSIVVPTYHRNDQLAKCLQRLSPRRQLDVSESYEVIVTDDGSESTAEEMIAENYPWVRWVAGPRRGPAANRNAGAKHSVGTWLVFTDDDCLPDSHWLSALLTEARSGTYEVLEGKTIPGEPGDAPLKYYVENIGGGNYWSCNLAVRRETFFRIGGFDEDFLEAGGEDMEFAYRIKRENLPAKFVSSALITHPPRPLTLNFQIWRTRMSRWTLLYDLKTRAQPALAGSLFPVLINLAVQQIVDLLRTTWHLLIGRHARHWSSQLVQQTWKWITFPFLLPYLMVWEIRFRRMLKERASTGGE